MTTSLRERNKRAAMEHVRTVAVDLMSERGFEAVTVEEIAEHASVSPSTVYRYFGTKEALVLTTAHVDDLVERLATDGSKRTSIEAFQRAATRAWGANTSVANQLKLVVANRALVDAWERQFLDQRDAVAAALATRRGAKSARTKDTAAAAAGLAVLMTMLVKWHDRGGGKKELDSLLSKAFAGL